MLTANRDVVEGPQVRAIAERLKATPAQVIFTFARQVGMLPITGTTDPVHMKQDLESLSFELNDDELRSIELATV